MFAPGSRYEHTPDARYEGAGGRSHPYKRLRELPVGAPGPQVHELADGERLDLVAFRYYGDPEQFWRICDANRALRPQDLETPGIRLLIAVLR
jgi:hypothetical protein